LKQYLLFIIITIFLSESFGQGNIIKPHIGIEGIPVVLDSTNINEIFRFFGTKYKVIENRMCIDYKYEELGLTFQVRPYDKNQLIRSVILESPFNGETIEGIVLSQSTMKDVWDVYEIKRCGTSKTDAFVSGDGIRFYFKKYNKKRPKKFLNEKVYKIRIHNDDQYGIISRVNFEFNKSPVDSVTKELFSILNNPDFSFKQLHMFLTDAEKTQNDYYGLKNETIIIRNIEQKLFQECMKLNIVHNQYKLNIISRNDSLVYLRLSNNNDSIIIERKPCSEFSKTDFKQYLFGYFCGFVGSPPNKCIEMLRLVNEKDYNTLKQWLNSINPEISAYGYVGFVFLNKKGITILPEEYNRMEEILRNNIKLYTCEGCYFGIIQNSRIILNDENINESYFNFEQLEYIK
jgi:hypothetical protein